MFIKYCYLISFHFPVSCLHISFHLLFLYPFISLLLLPLIFLPSLCHYPSDPSSQPSLYCSFIYLHISSSTMLPPFIFPYSYSFFLSDFLNSPISFPLSRFPFLFSHMCFRKQYFTPNFFPFVAVADQVKLLLFFQEKTRQLELSGKMKNVEMPHRCHVLVYLSVHTGIVYPRFLQKPSVYHNDSCVHFHLLFLSQSAAIS